jgi:hypothetical protein
MDDLITFIVINRGTGVEEKKFSVQREKFSCRHLSNLKSIFEDPEVLTYRIDTPNSKAVAMFVQWLNDQEIDKYETEQNVATYYDTLAQLYFLAEKFKAARLMNLIIREWDAAQRLSKTLESSELLNYVYKQPFCLLRDLIVQNHIWHRMQLHHLQRIVQAYPHEMLLEIVIDYNQFMDGAFKERPATKFERYDVEESEVSYGLRIWCG